MLLALVKHPDATNYRNLNKIFANTHFGIPVNNRATPWVGYVRTGTNSRMRVIKRYSCQQAGLTH